MVSAEPFLHAYTSYFYYLTKCTSTVEQVKYLPPLTDEEVEAWSCGIRPHS